MSHDEIMHMEIQAALDAMVDNKSMDKLMKSVDDSRLRFDFYKYCFPPVGFFDDDELNIARGVVRNMPEFKQVCVCGQIFVRGTILYNIYRERLRNAREDVVVVVEADDDDDTRNATEDVVVVVEDDDDRRNAREYVVLVEDDNDTRNATEYVVVVEHDDDDEAREMRK